MRGGDSVGRDRYDDKVLTGEPGSDGQPPEMTLEDDDDGE
jgi:hypothetical protein